MYSTNGNEIIIPIEKKVNGIGGPHAQFVFARGSFIQYSQIWLRKSFRQYLKTIMLFSKVLRMRIQKTT